MGATCGLSVAPQGPSLCWGWTAKEKFGIMGVLAQVGGLGSPWAVLSSCQRHWETLSGVESRKLLVEGVAVGHQALLLQAPA